MSAASPDPAPATIRPASPADLDPIRELLSLRDERQWDAPSTRWFVRDLDPAQCLTWLAFVGARPVGMSMMYLRTVRGPSGSHRAGYWANLFIDPDYRDRMLYPRLPLAMCAAAPAHGLEFIYTSVRLRDLAGAHTRIGFAKLGGIPLRVKPLRPLRLLGKYHRWGWTPAIAPLVDAAYHAAADVVRPRPGHGVSIEAEDPTGPAVEELVAMIVAAGASRAIDDWTAESFRYRYRQTREGGRYFLRTARRGGRTIGGIVYRFAERIGGIQAGVVMDAPVAPGETPALLAALAEAERDAHRGGCDLMMMLSGLGPEWDAALSSAGYRRSPEVYEMMIWPKRILTAHPALAERSGWAYTFRDHDAF